LEQARRSSTVDESHAEFAELLREAVVWELNAQKRNKETAVPEPSGYDRSTGEAPLGGAERF
jgi:hypothetical protein